MTVVICMQCGREARPVFDGSLCVCCWNASHGRRPGSIASSRLKGAVCEADSVDGFYSVPGRQQALVRTHTVVEEVFSR